MAVNENIDDQPISSVLISPKPVEMTAPVRLWPLILLNKGWVADSHYIAPRLMGRDALHQPSRWPRLAIRMTGSQTIALWLRGGFVEHAQYNPCSTKRVSEINEKGRDLVARLAPEIYRAAAAYARAVIGEHIRDNRRKRYFDNLAYLRNAAASSNGSLR